MESLHACTWPLEQMGAALTHLASAYGFKPLETQAPMGPPKDASSLEALQDWLAVLAGGMGIEAEPVASPYPECAAMLRNAGPALFLLPASEAGQPPGVLAFMAGGREKVTLLGPDLQRHQQPLEDVRRALCAQMEGPLQAEIAQMLDDAQVASGRRDKAMRTILHQRLRAAQVRGGWLLRLPPGRRFFRQVQLAGVWRSFVALTSCHAVQLILVMLAWWMLGRGALSGRLDLGWLVAWLLILLSALPFQLLVVWLQGVLAIRMGALLKQRLLFGALRLDPEEVSRKGAGQFLAEALESEAVESLAFGAGFSAMVASVELLFAFIILCLGAGGWLHGLLLLGWLGLCTLCGLWYTNRRKAWTDHRLTLTNELVERMVGHRTRLAQQRREDWHLGEDQAVEQYLEISRQMDFSATLLLALGPRGWLVLGFAGLLPSFVSGSVQLESLAIGLGGCLLGYQALAHFASGLSQLAGAWVAWQIVAPLFQAAARPVTIGNPAFVSLDKTRKRSEDAKLLEAIDVSFRYTPQSKPVLEGCSLRISYGDRLLLEGPSGGGKSTLASLLTGLRNPQSGVLLLHGFDHQTLGEQGWRQSVVAAPQFHENHIMTHTFAFNLLMGRNWPPSPKDLQEAEELCLALGLGPLLQRMPAGLQQMIGEGGWQLSHGEQSRLFIARALLQQADLIVLDESFAALDPENLKRALLCVLQRAPALLVIAHP